MCNAAEVCLVNEAIAEEFLPKLHSRLSQKVELRLDPKAAAIIPGKAAGELDFDTEFLDYILAVAVVPDVQAAAEHIRCHLHTHRGLCQ